MIDLIKFTNIKNDNYYSSTNNEKNEKENIKKIGLNKEYQKKYDNLKDTIYNLIIFAEFIKQFLSIIIHKKSFEKIVQNLFGMYSEMLDKHNFDDCYSVFDVEKDD